jgi:PAS domain S-box-containing protein
VAERLQLLDQSERQIHELERLQRELEQQLDELRTFHTLAENTPDGVAIANRDGALRYANPAFRALTGHGDAVIGMTLSGLYAAGAHRTQEFESHVNAHGTWQGQIELRRADGSTVPAHWSTFTIEDSAGAFLALGTIVRDMSEQRRGEQQRSALQAQVIEAQRLLLRELSTPIVPVADDVLLMPLIGSIDSARAQQIMEVLLDGVTQRSARTAILDLSGVPTADRYVADALLRLARAVRLIGAEVVVTGIRSEMARALVELGIDLEKFLIRSTVQHGIAFAFARSSMRGR